MVRVGGQKGACRGWVVGVTCSSVEAGWLTRLHLVLRIYEVHLEPTPV